MIKTALLLTGHYRTFDQTANNWEKYIINFFNCNLNVYLSTYEINGKRLDNSRMPYATALFDNTLINVNDIKNKNIFKEIIIEDYNEVCLKENFKNKTSYIKNIIKNYNNEDRRIEWFFSQYYKKYTAIQYLLKNNYDLIICSRPDFNPFEYIDININDFNLNNVYLSEYSKEDGYHDFYIIASPQNLLKIFNIYNEIYTKIIINFLNEDVNKITCGHNLLTYYIDKVLQLPVTKIKLFGEIQR